MSRPRSRLQLERLEGRLTPTATVTSVAFDEGSGVNVGSVVATIQRSQVRRMIVTFSEAVNFSGNVADAFALTRTSLGRSGGSLGPVSLTANPVTGPASSVTITFSGSRTESLHGGLLSLKDGKYDLVIDASQISGVSGALDGEYNGSLNSPSGNGTAGGNYVVIGSTASGLRRMFGDGNGDGTVNQLDYTLLSLAPPGPNPVFEFDNNNGFIDQTVDFNNFRIRFNSSP